MAGPNELALHAVALRLERAVAQLEGVLAQHDALEKRVTVLERHRWKQLGALSLVSLLASAGLLMRFLP